LIGGDFATGSPSTAGESGTGFGGQIGSVKITGSIIGGSGLSSGEVLSPGTIRSVTVDGDVHGGSAGQLGENGLSGVIHGGALGTVTIKGSLIGGDQVSGDAL
jgi:hypothetical protein